MKEIAESEVRNYLDTHSGFRQKNKTKGKDASLRNYLVKKHLPTERFGRFLLGLLKTLVTFGIWLKSEETRDQLFFAKKTVIQVVRNGKRDETKEQESSTTGQGKPKGSLANKDQQSSSAGQGKPKGSLENKKQESSSTGKGKPKGSLANSESLPIKLPVDTLKTLEPPVINFESNGIYWPYVQFGCCKISQLKEILDTAPELKKATLVLHGKLKEEEIPKFQENIALLLERNMTITLQIPKEYQKALQDIYITKLLEMLGTKNLFPFYQALSQPSKEQVLQAILPSLFNHEVVRVLLNNLPDQDLAILTNSAIEKIEEKVILLREFDQLVYYIDPSKNNTILNTLLTHNPQKVIEILLGTIDEAYSSEKEYQMSFYKQPLAFNKPIISNPGKFVETAFARLEDKDLKALADQAIQKKKRDSKKEVLYKLLRYAGSSPFAKEYFRQAFLVASIVEPHYSSTEPLLQSLSDNELSDLSAAVINNPPEVSLNLVKYTNESRHPVILKVLLKQNPEKVLNFFVVNRNKLPKKFLKKALQISKELKIDSKSLQDELETQISSIVGETVKGELRFFNSEETELSFDRLNIWLKFPVARRKWLEAIKCLKNLKSVILPEQFIANNDPHKVGTLEAIELLMLSSEPKPKLVSKKPFSKETWEALLAKKEQKEIWDHLTFDGHVTYKIETNELPFFIVQWLKIGPFKNLTKSMQSPLEKGLEDPDFLVKLAATLGEQVFNKFLRHLIEVESNNWGYGCSDFNWFVKNILPKLNDSQILQFYELLDKNLSDFIRYAKGNILHNHFLILHRCDKEKVHLKKFLAAVNDAYNWPKLIEKSNQQQRKVILSYLPISKFSWYSSELGGDYFSQEDLEEAAHQRLDDLSIEEIAYYRDFFSAEDLTTKAKQVLETIKVDENNPESFKEAFNTLATARKLTSNVCLLNITYWRNLYGEVFVKDIESTRSNAFIKSNDVKIRDLVALDAFFITLTQEKEKNDGLDSQSRALDWVIEMSYENEDNPSQGTLLGQGLAHLISNDDISLALRSLVKVPSAAKAFMQGLLKNNDPLQIQLAFRTLLLIANVHEEKGKASSLLSQPLAFIGKTFPSIPGVNREKESASTLLSQCLGFIDTKEKLEWVLAVWPEQDTEMEKTLLRSLAKETVAEVIKAPRKLSLIPQVEDYAEIENGIKELKERLLQTQEANLDQHKYTSFSLDWGKKLEKLKKNLQRIFRQDLMNPIYLDLLNQIEALSEKDRDFYYKTKLPIYTKKVESTKRRLKALKKEKQDLASVFPTLKILKRKIQRVPEYSSHTEIEKVIAKASEIEKEIDNLLIVSCGKFIESSNEIFSKINLDEMFNFEKSNKKEFYENAYKQLSEIDATAVNVFEYVNLFRAESYKNMANELKILRDQIFNLDQDLRKLCGLNQGETFDKHTDTQKGWLKSYMEKENYDLKSIKVQAGKNKVLLDCVARLENVKDIEEIGQLAPLFGHGTLPEKSQFEKAVKKTAAPVHPDRHPEFLDAANSLFQLINGIGDQILLEYYNEKNEVLPDPTWKNN